MVPVGVEWLQRALPCANSRAASITATCRACRCSGVIGWPCTIRPNAAGGAVANVGTGGSCDSPPDPMTSTRLPSVARYVPTAAPSARDPAQWPERCGHRVDEDRDHRPRRRVAEQLLQRLHRAVVHVHARRDRDVDAGFENGPRAVGWRCRQARRAAPRGCRSRRRPVPRCRCRTAASSGRRTRCSGPARR